MSINRVLVVLPVLAGLLLTGTAVARMMPVQTVRDSVYQTCAHNGVHFNKQGHANCGLHKGWSDQGSTEGSTGDTTGSEPGDTGDDQGQTGADDAGARHAGNVHRHEHQAKPGHGHGHGHHASHGHSGDTAEHGHSGHTAHSSGHGGHGRGHSNH
jgi:hypothetical protein